MMKVLFLLAALVAISSGAPSTVNGGFGGAVVKTGHVGYGAGGGAAVGTGGVLGFLATLGGGGGGGAYASKSIHAHSFQPPEVISEKIIDVEAPAPPPLAPARKTVIERVEIPQYVEKRVQVPTYVEKTIRVPTYVEKTIQVPAAPKIVETEISHEEVAAPKSEVKVIEHHSVSSVRPVGHHRVVSAGGGSAYGGGPVGFSFSAGANGAGLFDKIFNIPIQTLGAVNGLLNGIARGFTGGVSVSAGKAYSY